MTNTTPIDHIAADNKKVSDPAVPDELQEQIRQAIDDGILTHTGRSVGDRASELVADELLALFTQYARQEQNKQLEGMRMEWAKHASTFKFDSSPETLKRAWNSMIDHHIAQLTATPHEEKTNG